MGGIVTLQELEVIGLLTAIAALWDQLMHLLRWPRRLLVIERELTDPAARLLTAYLFAHARRWQLVGGWFQLEHPYVRSLDSAAAVFAESVHHAGQWFWLGRRPIWYTFVQGVQGEASPLRRMYHLRWSLDWDHLLILAAAWEHDQLQERGGIRYHVVHHGERPDADRARTAPIATPDSGDEFELKNVHRGLRLIGRDRSDIGAPPPMSIEVMSLNPGQLGLVADVDRFVRSRRWCEESTVPWRRGWLLKGSPGTGKTSIVRGLAVDHDLPIHVFDLGAMDNASLRWAWNELRRDTPAIALIEDIDGVYGVVGEDGEIDTRALAADGPTFDALLQCIGGIQTCDGVLLFVTTNRPERVDAALRRGGRIDSEVEFLGMDHAGRLKMARRILGSSVEAEYAASDPELVELSPANFQERLYRRALAARFGETA
jgi:hypothetical protein